MFVRNTDQDSKQQYYADSLLTKPSTTYSVLDNAAANLLSPIAAAGDVANLFSQKPEGNQLRSIVESVDVLNQTPGIGWGQSAANSVAGMIGYGLNPITWGFGKAGSVAVEAVIGGATKIAPDAVSVFMRKPIAEMVGEKVSKYIPNVGAAKDVPLSLAILGERGVKDFGIFAGAGVPAAVYQNYNANQNNLDYAGVAKDMSKMGVFGLAIDSGLFAFGLIKGKISRATGIKTDELKPQDYDTALQNGQISREEYNWVQDHDKDPRTPGLKQRASEIVARDGHEVNSVSNEVPFRIVNNEDMQNLQSGLADQAVSDMPEELKNSLDNYVVHNSLDQLREDPRFLDGVRGYRDAIAEKLKFKDERLGEANKILDDHLHKSVTENMPFSQKQLFKMAKKFGFESSHIKQLPLTIPDTITKNIAMQEKINYLKAKMRGKEPNKQTERRIADLEKKLPEVMTPKQELTHLREKLLGKGKLPKNFRNSKDYHRLKDLSEVWHNAKSLLNRVDVQELYEQQEAFKNLADHVLGVADSDVGRFANHENVVRYLRQRIADKVTQREPIVGTEIKAREQTTIPSDDTTVLDENEAIAQQIGAKEQNKLLTESTVKYKEFKERKNVFDTFIKCLVGANNG